MTVLPTVRRQLEQAAERQENRRPARGRTRVASEVFAGAARELVGVVGVAVALGFAILLVVLLRHHATTTHSAAPGKVGRIAPRQSGPQRLLKNDGIGDIHFGKTPRSVDLGLAQLFGRTNSDDSYLPGPHNNCGFDHYSAWFGLDAKPDGFRGDHRLFRAQLTVYFKRSRFVGYTYVDDQYISPGAPGDETGIPQNSAQARQVLHGPRITLATAKGLVLDASTDRRSSKQSRRIADATGCGRWARAPSESTAGYSTSIPPKGSTQPRGKASGQSAEGKRRTPAAPDHRGRIRRSSSRLSLGAWH